VGPARKMLGCVMTSGWSAKMTFMARYYQATDGCVDVARATRVESGWPGSAKYDVLMSTDVPVRRIEVVSDVICPWCYIGKRRLEKALALLGQGVPVAWRPFQLNPQMPPEGMERRAYRIAKFGSWERSLTLDGQVANAGKAEGIEFDFEKMTRTPNTLDAHRLILAQNSGVQEAIVERLFRAYFEEGLDLNRATLMAIAEESGMAADAAGMLAGEEGRADVLKEEARYKSLGVNSVPSFFLSGRPLFSGAADPVLLAEAIRQAGPL
jgi:predicted DsbA family dithiol-disulfide isomerase